MNEGLSHYIKASILNGSLKGLSLHGIQPTVSHSQFVDDTMMMGSPTTEEARKIWDILQDFSEASGTSINAKKYQIFFFNTPQPSRSTSLTFSDFHRSSLSSKYLGIPLIDNSQHNSSWKSLIRSLTKCLASWTFRSFNLVGCLVLLNSVLQVFPIYLFLTLATPKYVQTLLGHTKEILLAGY